MATRPNAPSREAVSASVAALSAANPFLAVGEIEVLGVPMRGYVNAPPDLRFLIPYAAGHGDKLAAVFEDQRWSFKQLAEAASAIGAGLVARCGVKPGQRVALAMRNCPEWMAAYLGIIAAGGVVVPLNGWWTSAEMHFALKDCGAKLVIAGVRQIERIRPHVGPLGLTLIGGRSDVPGAADSLDAIREAGADKPLPEITIDPDADFAVFYTSGSTGSPKGALLTHRGAVTAVLSFSHLRAAILHARGGEDPAGPNPKTLVPVPLFHVTASHSAFMTSLVSGRAMVLMRKWDPDEAIDLIERERITAMVGVPTMSYELALRAEERGVPLDSLIDIGGGGAKRPPAHVARLGRILPHVWTSAGYGLTESNAIGTYNGMHDYQGKPGSCGLPVPAVTDVKIVRADGTDARAGEEGEVWIRSPAVFKGYLNQPAATAAVLTPDRWLKTGDLGVMDEDGMLSIVGRLKDMLVRGGENVSCLEVEAALSAHDAILEAAVIAVQDERLGERVGAAIVLCPGADVSNEALAAFLEPLLASFKRPEVYWRLSGPLPRNAAGKLDKGALRAMLLTRETAHG